jgi:hypothetical protein
MKKLLLSIVFVLLALTLSAQKLSNYEKYWQAKEDSITKSQTTSSNNATENQLTSAKPEYDDIYYQPSKDAQRVKKHKRMSTEDTLRYIVDTLVKQNLDIQTNYYEYDPFLYSYNIGRFYHGGFNYWMYNDPWLYSNYCMMDNYYSNWGYGFMGTFWNPWYYNDFGFGYGYGWWYSNWTPWRHNYWNHDWNNNHNWYTHNNYNGGGGGYNSNHGYSHITQGSANRRTVQPQTKALYSKTNRSYSPSYNNPRMSTKLQYNNSRVATGGLFGRRANVSTQSRSYSQSNTQRNIAPNSQRSTQSRSYSVPSRSYNSSSRSNSNYSSGSISRGSNYSSGSYSSSGSSRSSGSYSGSDGGGRSSGGSSGRR